MPQGHLLAVHIWYIVAGGQDGRLVSTPTGNRQAGNIS